MFVSHLRVKEGKLEALREFFPEGIKAVGAQKPQTVAQLGYLNEDGTEVSFVHVFPDADAFDLHMEGAEERVATAQEFIEALGFEVYGQPSEQGLELLRREAPVTHHPEHLGGFLRLTTG